MKASHSMCGAIDGLRRESGEPMICDVKNMGKGRLVRLATVNLLAALAVAVALAEDALAEAQRPQPRRSHLRELA
jgi:hypothetical protein